MNDAFIAEDSLIMSKNRDKNPDENQLNWIMKKKKKYV